MSSQPKGTNMRQGSLTAKTTNPHTVGDILLSARAVCGRRLLLLLLLLLSTNSATVQAQFNYTVNDDGTVTITKYVGRGGDVVIPDTIDGLPVTSIGDTAFAGFAELTSVLIPNSVMSIGYWAVCRKLCGGRKCEPTMSASAYKRTGLGSLSTGPVI
jgi:hypothetical protein